MALPTLTKTWQFDVNQTVGAQATYEDCCDDIWLAIKNSLIGFASNPWTVWGSCDGINVYNNDGTDSWGAYSSLVHGLAGGVRSWIVLENAVLGVQICIDLVHPLIGGYYNEFYAYLSWAGFNSDGTLTSSPTASDRVALGGPLEICLSAINTSKLHIMHSTDGQETRVVLCYNSVATTLWCFGMAAGRSTAWTTGFVGFRSYDTPTAITYALFNDAAGIRAEIDGQYCTLYCTSEMMGTAMLGQTQTYPDDDTGCWPMCSMGLVNTAGRHRGRKGTVADLWWGSTGVAVGTAYPADASRQFAQFGDMIFPWDGSVPQVT